MKARCPGFTFHNTSLRSPHPGDVGYTKPDICCKTADNLKVVQRSDLETHAELAHAELFIQVLPEPALDFFSDPPLEASPDELDAHEFLCVSEDESLVRRVDGLFGQHIAFATELFSRQHRVFLFTIAIFGSHARFFRWDRAGCIVSSAFDIREEPELLCDFLWRFSQSSDAGRGHDSTVGTARPDEEFMFKNAITEHVRVQLGVEDGELNSAVSEHYQPGRVSAMHVLSHGTVANISNIRRFIVSRPVVSPLSLSGRGTRGYWAVDPSDGSVVFLKDTWRTPVDELEGHILQRLVSDGVCNIPEVVTYGDVPDGFPAEAHLLSGEFSTPKNLIITSDNLQTEEELQITGTDEFTSTEWVRRVNGEAIRLTPLTHHRLVLKTVGYGLRRFRGTEELLHATYDAFAGEPDAL